MNKALELTIKNKRINECDMLDCLNKKIIKNISITITTRVSAANKTFIVVKKRN